MSGTYLESVLARKEREVLRLRERLRRLAPLEEPPLDRADAALSALRRGEKGALSVIAEIKFRSPSAGVLRARKPGLPASLAQGLVDAGAAAISVLADRVGFGGAYGDVRRASQVVRVPVLFKDFVIDSAQVEVARRVGASLVLLIVRALRPETLRALYAEICGQGMVPLVEAADERELEEALCLEPMVVGYNTRDLRSFVLDVDAGLRAMERIPKGPVAVLMSGVDSRKAVRRVARSRADAVLIGSDLMRAEHPARRLRELTSA